MRVIAIFFFLTASVVTHGQTADATFHLASNQYIHKKIQEAFNTIESGLRKYPNDQKLNALKEKLKQEEKQKQDQNKEDQKQDQQNKDEEKKDDKNNKDEKKEQDQESKDEEKKKEQEKKQQQPQAD